MPQFETQSTYSDRAMRSSCPILILAFPILLLEFVCGCSQAKYSAASLPTELTAPRHISAPHINLSAMQRSVVPNEWLQVGDQVEVTVATGFAHHVKEDRTPVSIQ